MRYIIAKVIGMKKKEQEKAVSPGRPRIRVDKATVAEIRRLHDEEGISYRKLEKMFGISRRTIGRLLKKLSFNNGGM